MAMAAPNQPLPGLHVTAPDEDMEISDYERNADDIDIDIDLTVDPSHHEDENMDDDRSENDNRDDVMLDGDGNEDEDGMMQDNMSVPDEHLTDASDAAFADIEVKEAPQDEPVADQVDVEVQDSGQAEDYIDYDDTVEAQNQAEPEFPIQNDVEQPILDHSQFPSGEQGANQQQSVEAQNPEDIAGPQPVAQDQAPVAVEDHIQAQGVSVDHQVQESGDAHHSSEQPAEEPQNIEKIAESQPEHTSAQPVDDAGLAAVTEEEAQLLTEAPETSGQGGRSKNDSHQANVTATTEIPGQQEASEPAAQQSEEALDFSHLPFDPSHEAEDQSPHSGTSLHPVVVVYQGDEISLFPPDESDTSDSFYFLQDETLAHESIKNMLQACRQVLGETVREEDELEIDIVELGLCVTEDSEHAANTSFAQILDVYLQLHQLDGHQNPGPLYMTLNTKTRFSARLQSLLAAIADGRGMSQLSFVDDATEGEPYIDSEVAPEEKNPASQTGNHDQEGAQDPIPAADLSGSSNADAEQKPEPSAVTENQSEGHDAPSEAQPSGLQQPTEASPAARESQAQSYVSPPPEEIKKQESTEEEKSVFDEEGDVPNHESVSRTDDVAPDDQRENDQIDYDVENLDDAKDDASYRSSTLQGDNTPAVLEESTPRLDNASGLPQDDSTTSIAGLPHGESFDAGAEGPSGTAYGESQEHEPTGEYVEEQTSTVHVSTTASAEHESEHASQQEFDNADEALEQELERELNNQGESFDLPYDYPEIPDEDDYTENFEGGEYGYEQEANSQETQNGEETNEGYIVVETEDALESVHVADSNLPGDHQNTTHGDGFDDAEAEQTANNDLDGAHSAAENDLQDGLDEQAQPKAHASDEDDLDTIDYDDEELSQHDEAAVQSPSSAKRGWEELGQDDDDQADEQAPKKVKSE